MTIEICIRASRYPPVKLDHVCVVVKLPQTRFVTKEEFFAQFNKILGTDDAFLDANRIAPDRDLPIAFSASL